MPVIVGFSLRMYVVVLARDALQPHCEDVAFFVHGLPVLNRPSRAVNTSVNLLHYLFGSSRQWCATELFYTIALAVLASFVVHLAPAVPPKYNRYERWIPYITGNTTKAACQPK